METPYDNEKEATLAKALLEIGGECIGTTSPAEYARMVLDEVYPGRAPGSTMRPRTWVDEVREASDAQQVWQEEQDAQEIAAATPPRFRVTLEGRAR